MKAKTAPNSAAPAAEICTKNSCATQMAIALKSPEEINQLALANQLLRKILDRLEPLAAPGRTSREIAERFESLVRQAGAIAAFKNYQRSADSAPFPAACCISVNSVLTHGVPDDRFFRPGDIVKIDAGISLHGWFADAARTWCIEPADEKIRGIARAAREIFKATIAQCQTGSSWGNVRAAAIAKANELGVSLVPDVAGHGIGRRLHEEPSLPLALSRPSSVDELVLREGMVLAIEPVISTGSTALVRHRDGFGLKTSDGSIGAHYEECIAIRSPESGGLRRLNGL